ncbi:uncharacterized protein LOC143210697 [Lasioglossum baleicum]|uniref:uncharacterized protein LOC143210697 n=1 Tax=Lasioglossum baleicum TaxID=434251 RepID=UPI003FCE2194
MLRNVSEDSTKASMAATKIQANFRGYRVRKRFEESKKNVKGNSQLSNVIVRECEQTQDEYEQGEAESSIPMKENISLEEKSATKIQAGVRGFLVRKRQETARAAATRIQAGFRGFKTRKLLKQNGQ